MAQGIPNELVKNTLLLNELAEVAKDAALLHGVQMRIQETPNSSEVREERSRLAQSMIKIIHDIMLE